MAANRRAIHLVGLVNPRGEFMALCAIHQHFGRPGTPTDQAWIESLFGHVKAEWPHLTKIRDPATLRAELASVREQYNTVRLYAGIGYVTPNDEHEGRGEQIRKAREAGLEQARLQRIAYHRANHIPDPTAHPRAPSKSRFVPFVRRPDIVGRRHAAGSVQGRS